MPRTVTHRPLTVGRLDELLAGVELADPHLVTSPRPGIVVAEVADVIDARVVAALLLDYVDLYRTAVTVEPYAARSGATHRVVIEDRP